MNDPDVTRVANPNAKPAGRDMTRLGVSALGAVGVTGVLFVFMHSLIAMGEAKFDEMEDTKMVDFIRLRQELDLQTKRKRELPKKAPPKQDTNIPKMTAMKMGSSVKGIAISGPAAPTMDKSALQISGGPGIGAIQDAPLIPLTRVQPMYPPEAAQRGLEGWVELVFTVTPSGAVKDPRVVKAKPSFVFNRAAIQAIKKWKYRPKVVDGKPVTKRGERVRLNFRLEDQ